MKAKMQKNNESALTETESKIARSLAADLAGKLAFSGLLF